MSDTNTHEHVELPGRETVGLAKTTRTNQQGLCLCVCVCVCTYVSVWSIRVSMASLEWLIRGEVEENVSVRQALVKSPRALSLSVLTPLNLSLSSLTLTHSISIDTRYPAALQRPEENPLQWLSVWGEPPSLQRRKDYIMCRRTEQKDVSRFSGFAGFFSWHFWMDERKKTTEITIDQQTEETRQLCTENDESSHASICK